jgi:hypothetical protein
MYGYESNFECGMLNVEQNTKLGANFASSELAKPRFRLSIHHS